VNQSNNGHWPRKTYQGVVPSYGVHVIPTKVGGFGMGTPNCPKSAITFGSLDDPKLAQHSVEKRGVSGEAVTAQVCRTH
jgi:hypothetical protein